MGHRIATSNRKILQLNFAAIMLGLVFEFRRLEGKWSPVLWTFAFVYILSFLAFLPGKHERHYVFEEHLANWPWYFLFTFIIGAMAVLSTRLEASYTEGITLLLCLAFNYWIFAHHYWQTGNGFIKSLILLNGIFSVFALYHAFSYRKHSKSSRLLLSIGSSVIILILATDNIVQLISRRNIETAPDLSEAIVTFLEYFLLGISGIYLAQHLFLVLAYLPGKDFMKTVRETNDSHLSRFSGEQVFVSDAVIIALVSLIGFILNNYFNFLPVNAMIWITLAFAPGFLWLIKKIFS